MGSGEGTRSARVRSSNVKIASAARGHRFGVTDAVPFVCECGEPECELFLPLALHTYDTMLDDREWLVAAGHTVDEPGRPRAVVDHREKR